MYKAIKLRLYPTEEQKVLLEKHFGCVRFVYNYVLHYAQEAYTKEGRKWNAFAYIKDLVSLKKSDAFQWLNEVNAQSLQAAVLNLDKGMKNFFDKRSGFPSPKKKHAKEQSFCVPQFVNLDVESSRLKIPKFKEGIKCKIHRSIDGKIKNATVTKTKSGKYFVSLCIEQEFTVIPTFEKASEANSVGIDLGLKDFAITSEGEKHAPISMKSFDKKIRRAQKSLHRKLKGSKNRNKARLKLAKIYEKQENVKNDYLHKLSKQLIDKQNVSYFFVEHLNVAGMKKNCRLSKAIHDISWSKFIVFLTYKASNVGKRVLKIGRFFPSSKLCSVCGYKHEKLTLNIRQWYCPDCGANHDRDINAALNIRNEGIRLCTAGTAGIQACGEFVSPVISKAKL